MTDSENCVPNLERRKNSNLPYSFDIFNYTLQYDINVHPTLIYLKIMVDRIFGFGFGEDSDSAESIKYSD